VLQPRKAAGVPHMCTVLYKLGRQRVELVASFLSHRSFSHGPRWRVTAADESSAVRNIYGAPWESGGGNARNGSVFLARALLMR
jgi:hypothetical protein